MERLGESTDWAMPDYLAVWNTMNRDHLLKSFGKAIPAERITITGPPRFDYFFHSDRIPSREKLLAYLGFADAAATQPLLHCATTELYPFTYIIKDLHQAITNHDLPVDTLLYASVHPGGDISRHKHLEKFGARVKYSFGRRAKILLPEFAYLPTEEEIYHLIALFKHASVLINQSSTVAIESFAADVPIINVAYGQPWDWLRWPRHGRGWRRSAVYRDFQQHYRYITEEGATSLVKNKNDLIAATSTYLADSSWHRAERQVTLKKIISYTDGSNSQRLIDWLKRCAA
jgi:CDP-glycerol glycerophosphotransferase (TagB/SpsB family)